MTERKGLTRVAVATDGPWGIDAMLSLLERESYETRLGALDESLIALVSEWRPELAVIGWSNRVPGTLGLLRRLRRRSSMPILVVADSVGELDIIGAYEAGVDSVVSQRVGPDEMLARIRALGRRTRRRPRSNAAPGAFSLDVRDRVLVTATGTHHLSEQECLLLAMLLEAAGCLVTRTALARAMWGKPPEPCRKALDAYARRLRERLEADPSQPAVLLTVRGVGFLLERNSGAFVARHDEIDLRGPVTVVELASAERLTPVRLPLVQPQLSTPTVLT